MSEHFKKLAEKWQRDARDAHRAADRLPTGTERKLAKTRANTLEALANQLAREATKAVMRG